MIEQDYIEEMGEAFRVFSKEINDPVAAAILVLACIVDRKPVLDQEVLGQELQRAVVSAARS